MDNHPEDLFSTEDGKLRHENNFLKERMANLELFKKNFFELQHEMIEAREKIALLEEQLNAGGSNVQVIEASQKSTATDVSVGGIRELLVFFHESFSSEDFKELVQSMFQVADSLGVDLTVQVRSRKKQMNFAQDENHEKPNIALMNKYRSQGEIIDLGATYIINLKNMSMVANGLPVADPVNNQRIKACLEIIALGINTRIESLSKKIELQELRTDLYKVFEKTGQICGAMQEGINKQFMSVSELFQGLEEKLRGNLNRTGLPDDYVEQVRRFITDARTEINLLLTSSLKLDEHYLSLLTKLEESYAPEYSEDYR